MPNIDLSILNQRQTPAFYADVFANRPAAGFVGRIFISTNTFAFYRDNGTSWDLIGGPGTGTVTGTGANGQVTFWNGASTITGSNDLFWDATNGHLGVNTNAPGTALDVHHDQNTVAILNQTTATNDVRIGFQNNGVGLWRIGAFYNAGANDFGIFDAVGNIQPVTVKKTTGQVLIGTSTVGSGKLVVASATGDNGIQIVGASAPSLRIDSAESGPTKRAGLGISTATNNFIQGSADRDFCIFNGSTAAASPILFGVYDAGATNVQEAARISAARNFLVGTSVDAGYKIDVNGSGRISGNTIFSTDSATKVGIGTTTLTRGTRAVIKGPFTSFNGSGNGQLAVISDDNGVDPAAADVGATIVLGGSISAGDTDRTFVALGGYKENSISGNRAGYFVIGTRQGTSPNDIFERMRITSTGNLLIGTTTDAGQKLQVAGMLNSGVSYRSASYTDGDTTPSVTGVSFLYIQNSAPTSITNFTGGINYQIITLIFNDTNTTITRNNAYLLGGLNFVSSAADTLTLIYLNGLWYEVCRSINS